VVADAIAGAAVRVTLRLAVLAVTVTGLVSVRFALFTVLVAVVFVFVTVGVVVVSTNGVASVAAGAGSAAVGAGWDDGGSAGTGCASWAQSGVDENARPAAIAGRALVRTKMLVLVIIQINCRGALTGSDYRPCARSDGRTPRPGERRAGRDHSRPARQFVRCDD
jgi:hypothetical protein